MENNKYNFLLLATVCMQTLLYAGSVKAQSTGNVLHDTAFYEDYPEMVTTRFYFSQKYTAFTLQAPDDEKDLQYRPNTTLNMGVGATYRNFSLNLAYGFGFINQDKEKGKTKYLDLQGHFYPKGWSLDWVGQLYKGYYLHPKGYAAGSTADYYQRPDVRVNLFGIAAYRIMKNKKFSYRAAVIQNEWQKKSAGSLLLGGEIYYGINKADSSFVPGSIANEYPQAGINNVQFFSFGPGIGYAYTLVVQQHFFVTGSLSLNANLSFSTETGTLGKSNKTALNAATFFRLAAGYNSSTWNLSANWVGNKLPVRGASSANNYLLQTGNYRIIIAKKIMPGPRLKKRLKPLDKILG